MQLDFNVARNALLSSSCDNLPDKKIFVFVNDIGPCLCTYTNIGHLWFRTSGCWISHMNKFESNYFNNKNNKNNNNNNNNNYYYYYYYYYYYM